MDSGDAVDFMHKRIHSELLLVDEKGKSEVCLLYGVRTSKFSLPLNLDIFPALPHSRITKIASGDRRIEPLPPE